MPKLKESIYEQKNRMFIAEIKKYMELYRYTRKDIAKLWGVCLPTVHRKLNDPGKQTVEEMRILCKSLRIPEEVRGQFI